MSEAGTEFRIPIGLDAARDGAVEVDRAASPDACAAVAERFGLRHVARVTVAARLRRLAPGDIFAVTGRAEMVAERACSVTLDPFLETTRTGFEELYTTTPAQATVEDDAVGQPDELEIELIADEEIDLGEIALQYLAMALDPYPRKPGVVASEDAASEDAAPDGGGGAGGATRPFAGLDRLLRDRKSQS